MEKEERKYPTQIFANGAKTDKDAVEGDDLINLEQVNKMVTTINSAISALNGYLANKVDKVTGKDLSTNDFNNTYKSKLDNINVAALVKLSPSAAQDGSINVTGTSKSDNVQVSDILNINKPTNPAIVVADYDLVAGRFHRFNIGGLTVGEIRADGFRHPTEGYAIYEETPNPILNKLRVTTDLRVNGNFDLGSLTEQNDGITLAVFANVGANRMRYATSLPDSFISSNIARAEINIILGDGADTYNLTDSGVYTFTGNVSQDWILPLVMGNAKKRFTIINSGTSGANIVLKTNLGENQIWNAGTLINSVDVLPGETLILYNNTLNYSIL